MGWSKCLPWQADCPQQYDKPCSGPLRMLRPGFYVALRGDSCPTGPDSERQWLGTAVGQIQSRSRVVAFAPVFMQVHSSSAHSQTSVAM